MKCPKCQMIVPDSTASCGCGYQFPNGESLHELQIRVDHLLRRGILFSIVWLAGFGSLYAFVNGLRARKIIKGSNGLLKGNFRVWWCFVMGGVGMLVWFPLFIVGIFNNL